MCCPPRKQTGALLLRPHAPRMRAKLGFILVMDASVRSQVAVVVVVIVVAWLVVLQIMAMNPGYSDSSLPQVEAQPWPKVFKSRPHVTPDAMDLLSKMLVVRVAPWTT